MRIRRALISMRANSRRGCAVCATGSASSGGVFDRDRLNARHDSLETELSDPQIWSDRARAEALSKEKTAIERELGFHDRLEAVLDDAEVLLELAAEVDDAESRAEAAEKPEQVAEELGDAETRLLLGGEHDRSNAILSINSGAVGTDACDWAEILLRMYLRWCERRGFKAEILDLQSAEEAGIRGATLKVAGEYAYGYLNSEQGVHRLVRISPFDSQSRRHTAFASVSAVPEIDDSIEVEIEDADLRVDTYRASGAGGQHVNKTDSAIRITHEPTGVVVQCQSDRSQHKNRDKAMKQLRAKLHEIEIKKLNQEKQSLEDSKADIGWGSQIRSYVLDSSRIKDLRTGIETSNCTAVLDGNLDEFIEASLKANV